MYVEVAVPGPFSRNFIYEIGNRIPPGTRVSVPFGTRELQGFVVREASTLPPGIEIRPVTETLDTTPLVRKNVLDLCSWVAEYYSAPLGEVLRGALPPAITQKHVDRFKAPNPVPYAIAHPIELNAAQATALDTVRSREGFQSILLHGVTGSGKTEVYMRAVEDCRRSGKTALVLVPEINLTPQLRERFARRFGTHMALLHSALTRTERIAEWLRVYHGLAPIVIGTRSAVFSPLENLGLIIVDEEHESSYKQEEMPRYNGRDTAIMRAKMAGVPVVLGSATPSMESFHNARSGRYRYVHLAERVEDRPLPSVEIVNMREEYVREGRQQVLSRRLREALNQRLEKGEQSIVLLNRRGFSMFLLCRHCGNSFHCPDCSVAMTYHKKIDRLVCHYCGFAQRPPKTCSECESEYIQYVGQGTEQLEQIVAEDVPGARVGRVDRDTMRHLRDFDRVLGEFRSGKLDILVGTQMVAKGHDFPDVTLVGVVGADAALSLPDFRAAERTFQLLTQVAGRSGRGDRPGEVLIQSYFPDHYTFQLAVHQRFEDFYRRESSFRKAMFYPPFTVLVGIMVLETSRDRVRELADTIGKFLDRTCGRDIRILGPAPAAVEKVNKTFRHQILLKCATRAPLHGVLGKLREFLEENKVAATRVIVDVDPVSLT